MEGEFKNLLIGFILVGLVGMLMLMSVVQVGQDYGMDTSQIIGGSMSLDKFNQSVTNIETSAQTLKTRFEKGSIWSAVAGVVVEGIFGIAKEMFSMIFTPFTLIMGVAEDQLGVPTYVTSVIMGILIFVIIFAVWRLLKIGD